MVSLFGIPFESTYLSATLISSKTSVMDTSSQNFERIRSFPAFVDKSLMIKAVVEEEKNILIIAPRRFGKSVSEGLSIEFGKYPVIFINFVSYGGISSYERAFQSLQGIVNEAYDSHSYLQNSAKLNLNEQQYARKWCSIFQFETAATSEEDIFKALENLSSFLSKHYQKKVIVLVDEYDSICATAVLCIKDKVNQKNEVTLKAEDEIKKIVQFCVGALSSLMKGNDNVYRAIITGISYIMTMGLNHLNNVNAFRFQENHVFREFYGINSTELQSLLDKFDKKSEYEELIGYYNGYRNGILSTWNFIGLGLSLSNRNIIGLILRINNASRRSQAVLDLYVPIVT